LKYQELLLPYILFKNKKSLVESKNTNNAVKIEAEIIQYEGFEYTNFRACLCNLVTYSNHSGIIFLSLCLNWKAL